MTASSSSKQPAQTTRPRVTAAVCLVMAVLLLALAVLLIWASAVLDPALVGPAAATVVLASLCALIAVLAFQVAGRESGALPFAAPLLLFAVLSLAVGLAGAVTGGVIGALRGSTTAIGVSAFVLIASVFVALQGALVHGAARVRV
jgi:hypothetical protein